MNDIERANVADEIAATLMRDLSQRGAFHEVVKVTPETHEIQKCWARLIFERLPDESGTSPRNRMPLDYVDALGETAEAREKRLRKELFPESLEQMVAYYRDRYGYDFLRGCPFPPKVEVLDDL